MKKIFFLFAAIGLTALTGCEGPEGPQGAPGTNVEAAVFELNNVSFNFDGGYYISGDYPSNLNVLDSDVVLIYRLSDLIDSQTPIWQQIPTTMEFDNGYVNYDFDFSRIDYQIYLYGSVPNLEPDYADGQTFRIVVVPGYFTNKGNTLDYSDYNAVVKAYNVDESNVKQLTPSKK
ncbi:MAG: hypothetical protein EOO50_05575 [Flavobacterium sp.]|uniref:hypothetical protein n=1 Tax=Flavobacterium sp. TaxID=239 RepID=UPI0011F4913A|nr:hypothetical protein [Flavobacterium sp.]RZJ67457.1 MAG: hypothetical protein EOO50_05575 [Flavobacterium sp.]